MKPGQTLLAVLLAAGMAVFAGCSHYQLGTGAELPFRTLYVSPVANQTLLPQAREQVTARIREALLRDSRVTLADSPEAAEATLTVELTDYHREVATVREGDAGLARKFNLYLTASCSLRDHRRGAASTPGNGTYFFERRPITVQREAFTDVGQLQSEYQALSLLAESLAARISHLVLDVW